MSFATDLAAAYATEGESITVDGTAVTCFFNTGYGDALGVSGDQLALRCIATSVSAVAVGDSVTRGSDTYTVRGIQPIAPDGLETFLILETA